MAKEALVSFEPVRIPRGTVDLEGAALSRLRAVEAAAHEVFSRFGYREIRTPAFEETRLFVRAVGEATDVVEKEMFTIPRDGESYSLRPEGTAPVVRWYVENEMAAAAPFQKLYYAGPMFRFERPQAGRLRQFHQAGVECFGGADPLLDVEMILVQDRFFRRLALTGHVVRLNTIGCRECRPRWRDELVAELDPRRSELCENCRRRLDRNPLRVLDCKEEGCRRIAETLRPVSERVCDACRDHFRTVREGLERAGVAFVLDPRLVRGLDYYTRTVFETVHSGLGARSSICGGGRYDGLVEEMGGPPTPALGFAVGIEPTLLALEAAGVAPGVVGAAVDLYVVAAKDEARSEAFRLLTEIRDAGIPAEMDFEGRSMKAQMKKADRAGARYALIVGPGEIERGVVTIRPMTGGAQEELPREGFAASMGGKLGIGPVA